MAPVTFFGSVNIVRSGLVWTSYGCLHELRCVSTLAFHGNSSLRTWRTTYFLDDLREQLTEFDSEFEMNAVLLQGCVSGSLL